MKPAKTTIENQPTPRPWAYLRVSTNEQDHARQRLEILTWANARKMTVERFVTSTASTRKDEQARAIDVLKQAAERHEMDMVVFSELSRLGRSVGEICRLVDYFTNECGITLHFLKENLALARGSLDLAGKVMLTMFSLLAEIERDLISERTKSALAALKATGVKLGRPMNRSKLDKQEDMIRGLIVLGVKQKVVARRVGCTECTLSTWLRRKRPLWAAQPQQQEASK
ncbi:MAG: recombinase family protein [Nibricoccus sp.]